MLRARGKRKSRNEGSPLALIQMGHPPIQRRPDDTVIPVLTRNPVQSWIPASAGMTVLMYIVAGAIIGPKDVMVCFRHKKDKVSA